MTNTPFLSHVFFYYIFCSLILLNFIARFKPIRSWYKTILTCICIVGIGWFVPNYNVIFIGFLLFYTLYTILYSFEFKAVLRVLFIIITILPLIFYKLGVSPIFDLIGISYISFRVIQMFSDSEFMEKLSFQESFIFLFYPPTLLAGPIERSDRFVKNLNLSLENKNWPIRKGWEMFVLGVVYKYVLAVFVQKYAIEKMDFSSP